MKKALLSLLLLVASLGLVSCGSEAPLNEAGQAEKYNMSVSEYRDMKNAAAKMNMTIEEHMKMTDTSSMGGMDHSNMDMGDDSSMIEDDFEMDMGK